MPIRWILWTPLSVMISLPIMSYAALKFGEAGMDVLKYVIDPITLLSSLRYPRP